MPEAVGLMPPTVRRATPADVPAILGQLERFGQFFGSKHSIYPNRETAERIVAGLVESQPFWVAEETTLDGQPCTVTTDEGGRPLLLLGEARTTVPCWFDRVERRTLGLIGGQLAPHPFNPELLVLTELFWWVDPEHRGGRAGAMLLDAFTAYGEEHAHWILFTLEHESPVNDRCLTKRGFALKERCYLREVC